MWLFSPEVGMETLYTLNKPRRAFDPFAAEPQAPVIFYVVRPFYLIEEQHNHSK